jgi:transposase-like protein
MGGHHTEEFRADALNLVQHGDRSIAEVAKDLGISAWTLRGWCKRARMSKRTKKGVGAAPTGTETAEQKLARLERENARLLKENEQLRMDREILKKAAAFFAKENE